jgi:beta-glucosidase
MQLIRHPTFVWALSAVAISTLTGAAEDNALRAAKVVAAMTPAERQQLTHGVMALPMGGFNVPDGAILGAGFVQGVKRLDIPDLTETDASLGVAYAMGLRHDGATALPSGMALASSWSPELMRAGGVMIGAEARAKGFNVMLAGGANLIRDPRGGRTFEYLSEDPLLTGLLVGAAIDGIQSNHILSTIKHFALNGQETARKAADARISDAAARESDLLAFEIGIETGHPASVMCSYNLVNGTPACANEYLLTRVLKRDWHYPGFVMSDWGAVSGWQFALAGLDQQSGSQLDKEVYFGDPLASAAARDSTVAARVKDMATRIVRGVYDVGATGQRTAKPSIDTRANERVAQNAAEEGIVLLRNEGGLLPFTQRFKKIAVIGGYADTGVLSGGGSSQVQGEGGPAAVIPTGGPGPFAPLMSESFQRSIPLSAIQAHAPGSEVIYRNGRYITDAVSAATSADVAIVFATQWQTEGLDVPDLSLPQGQDALIAAVAAANPRTIVVLETGGPVLMPWLPKVAGVIEAWYPGARGADAIAAILWGDVNPSGRLPVTFPAGVEQLPRPKVDGSDTVEPNFLGYASHLVPIDYNIEGSDVGYRWFARQHARPLYPFGYGLSYTRFEHSGLSVSSRRGVIQAEATVRNIGSRSGADVVQIYLTDRAAGSTRRLVAFRKVFLRPGEQRGVILPLDARLLADWGGKDWLLRGGRFSFALGSDAQTLGSAVSVQLSPRHLRP